MHFIATGVSYFVQTTEIYLLTTQSNFLDRLDVFRLLREITVKICYALGWPIVFVVHTYSYTHYCSGVWFVL